jgi:DNA-directed RNA polymerase subunit beta
MSGTVIDVQVFTREGIERDKRAQQIIDDELARYRKDLNDQLRIVEDDTFGRIERLLTGKVANGGPKKLVKGTKITKAFLQEVERHGWFDIRLAAEDAASQLEQLKASSGPEARRIRCGFRGKEEEADQWR